MFEMLQEVVHAWKMPLRADGLPNFVCLCLFRLNNVKVFIFHGRDYTCYLGDLTSLSMWALEQLFSWGKLIKTCSVCGLCEWAGGLGPVFDSDSCSLCFSEEKIIYMYLIRENCPRVLSGQCCLAGALIIVSQPSYPCSTLSIELPLLKWLGNELFMLSSSHINCNAISFPS